MNSKTQGRKVLCLLGLLAAIAWSAVILLLTPPVNLGTSGWFCFVFVLACIAVAVLCLCVHRIPQNDVALIGIPFYASIGFIGVSVILNGIYLLGELEALSMLFITADLLLLSAYLATIVLSYPYQARLPEKMAKAAMQATISSSISSSLELLLSSAVDPDIHRALVQLKEKVDYSNNASQATAFVPEINRLLSSLQSGIENGSDKAEILAMVHQLEILWNKRNANKG